MDTLFFHIHSRLSVGITPNPSNVDDWRIFIFEDYNDARAGWEVFDSRESSTGWDLNSLTWTYPENFSAGESYIWFTQPITDDILGARGNQTIFHVPSETGYEINSTDAKNIFPARFVG